MERKELTATNVQIIEVKSSSLVDAVIYNGTHDPHALFINQNWQPLLYTLALRELTKPDGTFLADNEAKSVLTDNQIVDFKWDWVNITKQSENGFLRKTFYLVIDDRVQGALHAKFPKQSELYQNDNLVYIDFFAVAPWNRKHFGQTPLFKGVGTSLVLHTLNCSHSLGYSGVVGLHSLIQAEPFYYKLGMTALYQDNQYSDMTYFELPRERANALLTQE